jgi:hypothetical protein
MLGLTLSSDVETIGAAVELAANADFIARDDTMFINDLLGIPQPSDLRVLYEAMDNSTRDAGRRMSLQRLVERASRTAPRILVVEDLHWADRSTLTQLAALTTTVANCPAVLVMTSRLEHDALDLAWRAQTGASPLSVIELAPLHPDEAAVLAAPFFQANAAITARCVERAAGNPLFLEQLLREAESLLAGGVVSHNHLLFGKDAIEVCLEIGDWEEATVMRQSLRAMCEMSRCR